MPYHKEYGRVKNLLRIGWEYGLVVGAALPLLFVDLNQAHSPFEQLAAFLPLHTFMETFALVVACLIFGVGWHAYSEERPANTIVLACAFLGVGLLDFAHTLSYKGMPDFVTPASPDKGIFFWLAGRLLGAAALLATSLYPWKPLAHPQSRYWVLAGVLAVTVSIYWIGLFRPVWIPAMLVEGQGLTPLKIALEYLVIALLILAALGYLRIKSAEIDTRGLLLAVSITVLSELCFTLYVNVSDVFNLLGHIYKVVAYFVLYRTIFVASVRAPLIRLAASRTEIWQEKERAQITLKSIGDAVITADVEGRVENMNDAAEALTGWRLADGQGQPLELLFPLLGEYEGERRENPVKRCLRELRVVSIADDARLGARSGLVVPVEGSAAPVQNRQGELIGAVLVLRDISEHKRLEAQLRTLNLELEQRVSERTTQLQAANQELEAFSYSVSHDLRAPLRSVNGFSQLLLNHCAETLDDKGRDYLRRILAATQRMGDLIDGLLQLSRLGRGELRSSRCDLSAIAATIAENLRQSAPQRDVAFDIEAGLWADGDRGLLQTLLENLLGNAWKFTSRTEHASIAIGACSVAGRRVYYVRDNGVGFQQEYAHKLFAPFQRLHDESQFEGSGIGLATVQRIVQRHGGKIWAEGAPNVGAIFYFELPGNRE